MTGLDKALDIISALLTGNEVSRKGANSGLYEEFALGTEVYDYVMTVCRKLNMQIYEYNDGIYMTAGENNRVFGYTNEELKKEIGVKLNRELYLCYFIIYEIMNYFYQTEGGTAEYVKIEGVINAVDTALSSVIKQLGELCIDEVEKNSFKEIAMVWEDMPLAQSEEGSMRASRGSKSGFVKLVFNFLSDQELLLETEGRYYPKERFMALMTQYYEDHKGRLYEIMRGDKDAADKQD